MSLQIENLVFEVVANAQSELRNRIYQWTFQDGGKSDLALLLACRTIYLESNMLAFTQTTIKVRLKGSRGGSAKSSVTRSGHEDQGVAVRRSPALV